MRLHTHTNHARDAALGKLTRLNRWLLAASVTLTAVLTEVAARAFPGKTIDSSHARSIKARAHHAKRSQSSSSSSSLRPPAQAPKTVPKSQPTPVEHSAPAEEPTQAPEDAPASETPPTHESAPAPETSQPAPETQTPSPQESAPASEPSAPVVSGGS